MTVLKYLVLGGMYLMLVLFATVVVVAISFVRV
jgi:hypothetical protein